MQGSPALRFDLKNCEKCFLRDVYFPDTLHAPLAFLLFLEQFAFAR